MDKLDIKKDFEKWMSNTYDRAVFHQDQAISAWTLRWIAKKCTNKVNAREFRKLAREMMR